jgi:hypothetical protein
MHLQRFTFVIFTIFSIFDLRGQDERVFRDLLTHKNKKDLESKKVENVFVKVRSARYSFDFNDDSKNEFFYTSKIDGKDFLKIFDNKNKEVFRYKFDAHGPWSRIFRIQVRQLSSGTKVLLCYFYEGINRYFQFKGTSRLYFLTIDDGNLRQMKMHKGPIIWHEEKDRQENYLKRKYEISLYDFDDDGVREVSVAYKGMSRVFQYLGAGQWQNRKLVY